MCGTSKQADNYQLAPHNNVKTNAFLSCITSLILHSFTLSDYLLALITTPFTGPPIEHATLQTYYRTTLHQHITFLQNMVTYHLQNPSHPYSHAEMFSFRFETEHTYFGASSTQSSPSQQSTVSAANDHAKEERRIFIHFVGKYDALSEIFTPRILVLVSYVYFGLPFLLYSPSKIKLIMKFI